MKFRTHIFKEIIPNPYSKAYIMIEFSQTFYNLLALIGQTYSIKCFGKLSVFSCNLTSNYVLQIIFDSSVSSVIQYTSCTYDTIFSIAQINNYKSRSASTSIIYIEISTDSTIINKASLLSFHCFR